MKSKTLSTVLLALALCVIAGLAAAQEARDITGECVFTSPQVKTDRVHDGLYSTIWQSNSQRRPYLEITTPADAPAGYLYICFANMPGAWGVEAKIDGQWQPVASGSNDYFHALVAFSGQEHLRLIDTAGYVTRFKINEIFVLTEGELPDWVQQWEPTPEKADMLVLATHPDDELIFFGGTIPTYAAERKLDVVVAYMTPAGTTRRSELLNGLWSLGLRNYPVIGPFGDLYTTNLKTAYDKWGRNRTRNYVMTLIRKYKPEVVVTHDVNGEYGHGMHKLSADVSRFCVENAADPDVLREIAEEFGVWQVKKLYLHLFEENPVTMDWRVPLEAFGGKTSLELAQEAFLLHVSQQKTKYTVTDEGETSNARFGLAFTAVGPDIIGGDFMENIPEKE